MKCWTFNAEGSRVSIVAVHIRGVKIRVAAVEALRTKERGGEAGMKLNLPQTPIVYWVSPRLNANVLFCISSGFFLSHPVYDQSQGSGFWCCVFRMLVALEKYSSTTPSDPLTISWPFDVVEKAIQNQYFGERTDVLINVYFRCAKCVMS